MSVSKLFENGKRPNLLLIITDQERSLQHWPKDFYEAHLPNMCRLLKHGLHFENYFTNACMCSPSRATLMTSQFPVVTGVTTTGSPQPRFALPTEIPNLATILQRAGYHMAWHGKWHLGGTPSDYGFQGWQPPDAGNYLSLNETLGGGEPNNDGRFLDEICTFLDQWKARSSEKEEEEPFCLVASFVNPHDVYVAQHEPELGYSKEDFHRIQVPVPSNCFEDLNRNNKPRAHAQMSLPYVAFANTPEEYIQFYAYLHTVVDTQIGTVLDKLEECGFTESTLILRTSDHGEQGLSHSLVEKFYNAYEESIHIPLVVSNPLAYPTPFQTKALASHVDLLPTLASLLKLDLRTRTPTSTEKESPESTSAPKFAGKDLTPVLDHPLETNRTVQDSIHFTYDDIPCRIAPSIVRSIRTARFKYTVYFKSSGKDADWELYDLEEDSLENHNLAGYQSHTSIQKELEAELVASMKHCGTLPPKFQWPPRATKYSRGIGNDHPLSSDHSSNSS